MEILAAMLFFGLAFAAMSVGVIFADRELKGSCGGIANHPDLDCGVCERKSVELCPSDEPLVKLAQIAHPNPRHHRT
jgi:hypothetical protein